VDSGKARVLGKVRYQEPYRQLPGKSEQEDQTLPNDGAVAEFLDRDLEPAKHRVQEIEIDACE